MKCPFCGYDGQPEVAKEWKFRFYTVQRVKCPMCGGIFNQYAGTTPAGRFSEFIIRVKPRPKSGR